MSTPLVGRVIQNIEDHNYDEDVGIIDMDIQNYEDSNDDEGEGYGVDGIPLDFGNILQLNVEGEAMDIPILYNESDDFQDSSSDDDVTNRSEAHQDSIKHIYREATWDDEFSTYSPMPRTFIGVSGPMLSWRYFPSFMQLFHLFWPEIVLHKIVDETNR